MADCSFERHHWIFEGLLRVFPGVFFLLVTKTGLLFTGRPSPSVIVARKSLLLKQTMFYRTLIEGCLCANIS